MLTKSGYCIYLFVVYFDVISICEIKTEQFLKMAYQL